MHEIENQSIPTGPVETLATAGCCAIAKLVVYRAHKSIQRTIPVWFNCTAVDQYSDDNDNNYHETRQTNADYNYDSVVCSFV